MSFFTICFTPSIPPCRLPYHHRHHRPRHFCNPNRNPNIPLTFNTPISTLVPTLTPSAARDPDAVPSSSSASNFPLQHTISALLQHSAPPVLLFLALFTARADAAPVLLLGRRRTVQENVEQHEESYVAARDGLTADRVVVDTSKIDEDIKVAARSAGFNLPTIQEEVIGFQETVDYNQEVVELEAVTSTCVPVTVPALTIHEKSVQGQNSETLDSSQEDKELNAEFERWKSKTFALLVPLRIVALQGSVPPSWLKEFIQSQGKRLRLRSEFRGSLESIFNELSKSLTSRKVDPKSAIAADAVSMGDSWLTLAIKNSIIDPMDEGQDWFKDLNEKWKIFLRRNNDGAIDCEGKIWAAPYRWGSMVIAYKKTKFQKHKLKPVEDWEDLWQPGLQGRISMVGCPREVVGAVLKYMGSSYNTDSIELQVSGGRNAVLENLCLLRKQVRFFDSANYLKAFGVGDAWVAVGWSSDILPAAKRMSNVVVIVPKSGASLWADLWTIPAASRLQTERIGGRVRGPSPLTNQWIEFCLQPARASPFKKEVVPGATPSALDCSTSNIPPELKGSPKLETNLIAGVPPPDILSKCEFLEPLSDTALSDHQWLISQVQKADTKIINRLQKYLSSTFQSLTSKIQGKVP